MLVFLASHSNNENADTNESENRIVPLAPQVLALLYELEAINGESRFVFPNSRTLSKPMSEGTMAAALASIGYGPQDHRTAGAACSTRSRARRASSIRK